MYTMFPVFSLVLDKDVKSEVAMLYPELYKDLLKVFNKCPIKKKSQIEADCGLLIDSFLSTGSTTVFQDFSHMGSNKYLSR